MPALSLLIKPASSLCNLRCTYCFYQDVAANRETPSYGVMTPETLETVVDRALSFATGSCTFAFQGGEPTLAGLDFFRRFEALLAERTPKTLSISRALQTNGLLVDEEWAAFLAQHHYLVGLSLDGPSDLHDARRPDAQGRSNRSNPSAASRPNSVSAAGREKGGGDTPSSPRRANSPCARKYRSMRLSPCNRSSNSRRLMCVPPFELDSRPTLKMPAC